ncbi:hypothetical protein EYR41_005208 [Orbilia oligospora]|uniref:Uncharacterized protein n=1 Tax=Orbilia oligospora TaxID=2813651 RepID=A0A7C8PX53_ORBOL|nr:hypothetical protein TWF751_005997 [Orbilia oligospora]TGJ69147.1 hypothetical protein EYR41_005208 [Orbilia oligospora]
MAAEITQTTTMFNCLLLSVLRRFKSNQLWNFIWLTDMHLTPTIVNELDARQNMLQGAWVFGPDDLESSGIIAGSLQIPEYQGSTSRFASWGDSRYGHCAKCLQQL